MIKVVADQIISLQKPINEVLKIAEKNKGLYLSLIEKSSGKRVNDDLVIDIRGIHVSFDDDYRTIYGWDEISDLISKDRRGLL